MRFKWICRTAALALLALGWGGCGGEAPGDVQGGKTGNTIRREELKSPPPPRKVELVWPTPNEAFWRGEPVEVFIQPTASGLVRSGLFGSVRSGGRQFHEGIDLLPLQRDRKGEALDPVRAAMAGVVRRASRKAGASSFGRYVVLEHTEESPSVYTLYAHLEEVAAGVVEGKTLAAGEALGKMGRSAGGYTIPKDRAHLHFEIGLRVTDRFQAWYSKRGFGSVNEHGLWNGMNLMGVDPLPFFAKARDGGLSSLDELFLAMPVAVLARVARPEEPDFIRRYPTLLINKDEPVVNRIGWEIAFDASGVPIRWRSLDAAPLAGWKRGEVRIMETNTELLAQNRGRELVKKGKNGPVPGDDLKTVLEQLFGG